VAERSERERELGRLTVERPPSLAVEFWRFLKENKAWWLAPILLAALVIAALVVLSQSAAAPFIYPFL